HRLRADPGRTPKQANRLAVIESITKIGPVMLTAGIVAVAGFFSLMVFDNISIRVFGIFTGVGILSVVLLEMIFIPALRALQPPLCKRDAKMTKIIHVTNTCYVRVDGDQPDAITDPAVLKAMDELQAFLSKQPSVGKVVSLTDFIKRMNQAINGNDPAYFAIP